MVREIIQIQIGGCGNQLATKFWNSLLPDHLLTKSGKLNQDQNNIDHQQRTQYITTYFNPTKGDTFMPRAICIDSNTTILDKIQSSPISSIFQPDNIISNISSSLDHVSDIIRKETEKCDNLQCFQFIHSIAGKTGGSGLASSLLSTLKDNHPKKSNFSFSILPTAENIKLSINAYNSLLTMEKLLTHCNQTIFIDNQALFKLCTDLLKIKANDITFDDYNWISSLFMNGATVPFRFYKNKFQKLMLNLTPFPRLHFFMGTHVPYLGSYWKDKYLKLSIAELTDQIWSARNYICDVKTWDNDSYEAFGKYLSIYQCYRGDITLMETYDEIHKMKQKMADEFVWWIADDYISDACCGVIMDEYKLNVCGTMIVNHTGIQQRFKDICDIYLNGQRKEYFQYYKNEGIELSVFNEAVENINSLLLEYQEKENIKEDEEDYDEDDDEEYEDTEDEEFEDELCVEEDEEDF